MSLKACKYTSKFKLNIGLIQAKANDGKAKDHLFVQLQGNFYRYLALYLRSIRPPDDFS